jgi:uncharacterized membrane protein YczE
MRRRLPNSLRSALRLIGTSRHSALPLVRARIEPTLRSVGTRAAALIFGSTLIGTAVAFLVQADLGLAPYDMLSSSIGSRLDISLGQAGWLVAAVLFTVATLLGRRPSIWGAVFIITNGIAIDSLSELINPPRSATGQALFVLAAIAIMATGVNLVLYSGTTGGPFELLMLAGEDRGINQLHTRYALDGGVFILGLALGGTFGVATVIYAVLMGVVLQGIRQTFADYDTGRRFRLSVAGAD